MKFIFNRGTAAVLFFIQLSLCVPAQTVFDLSRAAGFGRLEVYFERASRERSAESWQRISEEGLSSALSEWERAAVHLKENGYDDWEKLRSEFIHESSQLKSEAYAEWLAARWLEDASDIAHSRFAAQLQKIASQWTYGSESRSAVALHEAETARGEWRGDVSEKILEQYINDWEAKTSSTVLVPVLVKESGIEETVAHSIAERMQKSYRVWIACEYERTAAAEEHALMNRLLYDQNSLKKAGEQEAANLIAAEIAEKVKKTANSSMNELFSNLDVELEAQKNGGVHIDSENWIESFKTEFDKALGKWDAAEREFLVARAEWEKNAEQVFLDGEQSWAHAYELLNQRKKEWQLNLQSRFEQTLAKWQNEEALFGKVLRDAQKEFTVSWTEREKRLNALIDLHINTYDQSRQMTEMALEGINFWYGYWASRYEGVYSYWKTEDAHKIEGIREALTEGSEYQPRLSNTDTAVSRRQLDEWKTLAVRMISNEYEKAVNELQKSVFSFSFFSSGGAEEYKRKKAQLEKLDSVKSAVYSLNAESSLQSAASVLEKLSAVFTFHALTDFIGAWEADAELESWLSVLDKSAAHIDSALEQLYSLTGSVFTASGDSAYLDELSAELLKARAVKQYWDSELAVAVAVDEYASNRTSSADWESDTKNNLRSAKENYEKSVLDYEREIGKLEELKNACSASDNTVLEIRSRMAVTYSKAEKAREAYSAALAALSSADPAGIKTLIAGYINQLSVLHENSGLTDAAESYYRAWFSYTSDVAEYGTNEILKRLVNDGTAADGSVLDKAERAATIRYILSGKTGLEDMTETDETICYLQKKIEDQYASDCAQTLNSRHTASLADVRVIIAEKGGTVLEAEIDELYDYFAELEQAGQYVLNGTRIILRDYMSALLKYAAVRDVQRKETIPDHEIESLRYESLQNSILAHHSWIKTVSTFDGLLNFLVSPEFAEEKNVFFGSVSRYFALLAAEQLTGAQLSQSADEAVAYSFLRRQTFSSSIEESILRAAAGELSSLIADTNFFDFETAAFLPEVWDGLRLQALYALNENQNRIIAAKNAALPHREYALLYANFARNECETSQLDWVRLSKQEKITETKGISEPLKDKTIKIISEENAETVLTRLRNTVLTAEALLFDDTLMETISFSSIPFAENSDQLISFAEKGITYTGSVSTAASEAALALAENEYAKLLQAETSTLKLLYAAFDDLINAKKDNGSKEDELRAAEFAFRSAQGSYEELRRQYSHAVTSIEIPYAAYNAHLMLVNSAFENLQSAKLERSKAQSVFDWASSVYLENMGGGKMEAYTTPKEKVTEIRYASLRSQIAVDVLNELRGTLETKGFSANPDYEEAFTRYEKSFRQYYFSRALGHETLAELERMKDVVRGAETAEIAALEKLVVDYSSVDTALVANKIADIPFVILERTEIGFSSALSSGTETIDSQIAFEYFTEKNIEFLTVDGSSYKSCAAADALNWLRSVYARSDAETYLTELGLAFSYAILERDGKKFAPSGDVLAFALNNWNRDSFQGINIQQIFSNSYQAVITEAYNKIMASEQGKNDFQKYALFRETSLINFKFAEREKNEHVIRALKKTADSIRSDENSHRTSGHVFSGQAAGYTAGAVVAACFLQFGLAGTLGALAAACGFAASQEYGKANGYRSAREDLEKYALTRETNKYQDGLDYFRAQDFSAWKKSFDNLRIRQEKLARYYGKKPADSKLTYAEFVLGVGEMLDTANGGVKRSDFLLHCTEKVFVESAACLSSEIFEAVTAVNNFFDTQFAQTSAGFFDNYVNRLAEDQKKAANSFNAEVNKGFEIEEDVKKQLRAFALQAGDVSLSVSRRAQASREYDALVSDINSVLNISHYKNNLFILARRAFADGSWRQRDFDERMSRLAVQSVGMYTVHDKQTEDFVISQFKNARESILSAVHNVRASHTRLKDLEMDLALSDFYQQYNTWADQMRVISQTADCEWEKAFSRLNEEFDTWRSDFKSGHSAQSNRWQKNYEDFLSEKQSWITEQYVYAVNAANASALRDSGANLKSVISRSLNRVLLKNKNTLFVPVDAHSYTGQLFSDTHLNDLLTLSGDLASRADALSPVLHSVREKDSTLAISSFQAELVQQKLNDELTGAASKLAALLAREQFEELKEQFKLRLESENLAVEVWQNTLVRENGYTVSDAGISRNAVVRSTLKDGAIRERQNVHKYQYFKSAEDIPSITFNEKTLDVMNSYAIQLLVEQGRRDLQQYSETIFGKITENGGSEEYTLPRSIALLSGSDYSTAAGDYLQKQAERIANLVEQGGVSGTFAAGLSAENLIRVRSGKLAEHIGFAPLFKTSGLDLDKSRLENILDSGKGQIGLIMLDFQWNSMLENRGIDLLGMPGYYQPIWDSPNAPTVGSIVDLAMSMLGSVSFVGIGSILYGLVDDVLLAGLDVANGYRSPEMVLKDLAIKSVSSGISMGSGALSNVSGKISSPFLKTLTEMGVSAGCGLVNTAASNFIGNINFENIGSSNWFNTEEFTASMTSAGTWAHIAGGAASIGFQTGINLRMSGEKHKLYAGVLNLAASGISQAVNYGVHAAYSLAGGGTLADAYDAMGGVTLNVLNAGALFDFTGSQIARNTESGRASLDLLNFGKLANSLKENGLFEVNIGRNGITGNLGAGGIDVAGQLYDVFKRSADTKALEKFILTNNDAGTIAKELYFFGDWTQENTAMRLASEHDTLIFSDKEEKKSARMAQTIQNGRGGRILELFDSGNLYDNVILLGHEAYRDGVTGKKQERETVAAVIAHTELALNLIASGKEIDMGGALSSDLMLYSIASKTGNWDIFEEYVNKTYDSSADYWLFKLDGSIVDDKTNYMSREILGDDGKVHAQKIQDSDFTGSRIAALVHAIGTENVQKMLKQTPQDMLDVPDSVLKSVMNWDDKTLQDFRRNPVADRIGEGLLNDKSIYAKIIGEMLMYENGITWDESAWSGGFAKIPGLKVNDSLGVNRLADGTYEFFTSGMIVRRDDEAYYVWMNDERSSNYETHNNTDVIVWKRNLFTGEIEIQKLPGAWTSVDSNSKGETTIGNNTYKKNTIISEYFKMHLTNDVRGNDYGVDTVGVFTDAYTLGGEYIDKTGTTPNTTLRHLFHPFSADPYPEGCFGPMSDKGIGNYNSGNPNTGSWYMNQILDLLQKQMGIYNGYEFNMHLTGNRIPN